VASVAAIVALITRSLQQELATIGAFHDLIELAPNKFVAIHLVDLAELLLLDGPLTAKASVDGTLPDVLLDYNTFISG
jgi:hypothetical protein